MRKTKPRLTQLETVRSGYGFFSPYVKLIKKAKSFLARTTIASAYPLIRTHTH